MVFEKIEQLKSQFTDKYVVVDASRPELRRFGGMTGMVKTVNMSGRALVQFDADNNIGWYDIDLGYLKVVDAPPPKPEAKEAKKAAPKAEGPTTPAAHEKPVGEKPAAAKAAAKPAAAGGKSVADILAAARSGAKAEAKPAPASGDKPKQSTAEILAAARSKAPASAAAKAEAAPAKPAAAAKPAAEGAKVDPKKMSVAEILAAARGKGGAAPAAAPAKKEIAAKEAPPPAEEPAQEEEAAAEQPVVAAATPAPASGDGKKSKQGHFKTVAEIVAFCRQIDAKK